MESSLEPVTEQSLQPTVSSESSTALPGSASNTAADSVDTASSNPAISTITQPASTFVVGNIGTSTVGLLTAGSECYAAIDAAATVYQSIGLVPELCSSDGIFAEALQQVTSCLDAETATSKVQVNDLFIAESFCASWNGYYVVVSTSGSQIALSTQVNAGDVVSSVCKSVSVSGGLPPDGILCTSTQASQPTFSPNASPTREISAGAIAGIAVGVVIGIVFTIVFIFFFFVRRHRKNRTQAREKFGKGFLDKPELHANDYTPQREELEGSKPRPRIKEIAGLNELENAPLPRKHLEMAANETVGQEVSGMAVQRAEQSPFMITSPK